MADTKPKHRIDRGAYGSPFSGVGVEFFPLGVLPDHSGLVLHESGFTASNSSWRWLNVLSPFWRLYCDPRPGHKVIFEEREVPLGPDRLVLIPPRVLFHCAGDKPVPKIWFTFNLARHPAPGQPLPFILRPTPAERQLLADFRKLFRADDTPTDPGAVFHLSQGLLHVVLGRADIRWATAPARWVPRVTAHIEQHYAEPIYRRDLARLAGVSEGILDRTFKQHHGCGPVHFITQVRVHHAARLLTREGTDMEEIAEQTGFPNRAYFSRVFKRITGQSPAEFRRNHREQL